MSFVFPKHEYKIINSVYLQSCGLHSTAKGSDGNGRARLYPKESQKFGKTKTVFFDKRTMSGAWYFKNFCNFNSDVISSRKLVSLSWTEVNIFLIETKLFSEITIWITLGMGLFKRNLCAKPCIQKISLLLQALDWSKFHLELSIRMRIQSKLCNTFVQKLLCHIDCL